MDDDPHATDSNHMIQKEALQWRHNDYDSISNQQPHCCLLNRLFGRRSKKISKLRVTGLCVGNSPGLVNSPHKGPVTQKMFHLMTSSWVMEFSDGYMFILISKYIKRFQWFKSQHIWRTMYVVFHCVCWWQNVGSLLRLNYNATSSLEADTIRSHQLNYSQTSRNNC